MNKNVISVIDGAAGSCGKGKVIGELVTDPDIKISASVTNCMPNAGHTVFIDKKRIFKNIPVSIVNPNISLFIGPGSIIDMDDFINEYEQNTDILGDRKIYVHEMVPIILNSHKLREKEILKSGSTFKGCGAALSDKVMRCSEFFKGYKNAVVLNNDEWLNLLYSNLDKENEFVLLEGAQGCDLSINHSGNYPFTTSRNVSTMQLLADTGISAERLYGTIMVIRPFPIRISNVTNDGAYINTGDYGKGDELTWSHINYASTMGFYPTKDMFDDAWFKSNITVIKKYLQSLSNNDLLQIFKNKCFDINCLSLIDMLEIERLYYKKMGVNTFYSDILQMEVYDQSENTTVTKKERRVFDLDINKLKMNCMINSPFALYLNFFQHLDNNFTNFEGNYSDSYINKYIREYINWLENETNTEILSLGTGPKNHQRIKKRTINNLV